MIIIVVLFGIVLFIGLNMKQGARLLKSKIGTGPGPALLHKARDLKAQGNFQEALAIYQKLINDFPGSSDIINWQKELEAINIKLLFSPAITPKSTSYEIKRGDTLAKIAKEFNTTVELLKASNNLASDKILPGRKIKVWTAPFSILVDKSQNVLFLKSDEELIKTYTVATGANNSTPVGAFKIVAKLIQPTWYKAGTVVPAGSPENILGSRWLGLNLAGYGIHGTTDPQSLGKQVTQGCVRMANSDVEELYIIVPKGAEVTIVD